MERNTAGCLSLEEQRKRAHWSFSSLNQLLNICSLQWAFQRVYKLQAAFTPVSLCFGSAFHRTMEWIGLSRMQGDWPEQSEAQEVFSDMFSRHLREEELVRFGEGQDESTLSRLGRGLVACFVENMDREEEVTAVNYTFCAPLRTRSGLESVKPLIGEIDAVYRKDGQVLLIDWKTSARRWPVSQARKSLQATAMCYGYCHDNGVLPEFRFDVLVKNKTPVFEQHQVSRTQDDFERLVRLAERAESISRHYDFYPSEQGYYCAGCPYQEPCEAWHRKQGRMVSLAA